MIGGARRRTAFAGAQRGVMGHLADYQNSVIAAATTARIGRTTLAEARRLRERLDAGAHFPATSPVFTELRIAAEAFLEAFDAGRGLRSIGAFEVDEAASDALGEAIVAVCRSMRSDLDGLT